MQNKIIMMGDVHGNWGALNSFMNRISYKNKDLNIKIFVCGDFGYWWSPAFRSAYDQNGEEYYTYDCCPEPNSIKIPQNVELYWLDGNHENHTERQKYELGKIHEIESRLFYCARFSTLELPETGKILFVGGADSIDKMHRTEGVSWWKEELISTKDMDYFYDNHPGKVDIVLSHTCPTYFTLSRTPTIERKGTDPSKKALDIVFDECGPKEFFFGHYHRYQKGKYQNCHWTMLNRDSQPNWWIKYKR